MPISAKCTQVLKEGWDCPFAYVLATIANKTSKIAVEQVLGRILRQPYANKHRSGHLNTSYVLTCSNDFHDTLENIVKGLNSAGFSRKDYRVGEDEMPLFQTESTQPALHTAEDTYQSETALQDEPDIFSEFNISEIQSASTVINTPDLPIPTNISNMLSEAKQQTEEYEQKSEESDSSGFIGGELGEMLNQYHIQPQYEESVKELRLPQFFLKSTPDLFGGDTVFLEKDSLLDGFTLSGQNAEVNFTLSAGEIFTVDIQAQGDNVPKYKKMSQLEKEFLGDLFARMAPEQKIESCTMNICRIINSDNTFSAAEIEEYVRRVIANMTEDELAVIETSFTTYARKIKDKIDSLKDAYREKKFYKWLDSGMIICENNYTFPQVITPSNANNSVPLSLYESENDNLNNLEKEMRDIFPTIDNVEWWHRVIDRKGFRINGFINHYPDFIVKMKSGRILLIETKGDDRDNSNSERKLKLGKRWASQAGTQYKYFMVFDRNPIEDAYTLDEFADMLRNM